MIDDPVQFVAISLASGFPLGFLVSMLIFMVRAVVHVFNRIVS